MWTKQIIRKKLLEKVPLSVCVCILSSIEKNRDEGLCSYLNYFRIKVCMGSVERKWILKLEGELIIVYANEH